MMVGYLRVSTHDQDLTVQRARLAHCERLYADTGSGTDAARPQLQACLDFVREGDTVCATRLDRLARSTLHLYQIVDILQRKGVQLHILDQAIDTHTETGRLLFGILAVIAQFETELRAARQQEGIAKAKAQGRYVKRQALSPAQVATLRAERAAGDVITVLMRRYALSKASIYRYLTPREEM